MQTDAGALEKANSCERNFNNAATSGKGCNTIRIFNRFTFAVP